jgi:hypothetical protein
MKTRQREPAGSVDVDVTFQAVAFCHDLRGG